MRMSSQWILKYQLFRCECTWQWSYWWWCTLHIKIVHSSLSRRIVLSHRFMCHNASKSFHWFLLSFEFQSTNKLQRDNDKMIKCITVYKEFDLKVWIDIDSNTFMQPLFSQNALNRVCFIRRLNPKFRTKKMLNFY